VVGVWIEEVDLLTVHPEISLGRILLGVPYPWHLQKLERKQSTGSRSFIFATSFNIESSIVPGELGDYTGYTAAR